MKHWLVHFLARGLEPTDREVVLGDVAEDSRSLGSTVYDVLDVIVRRQAGLWSTSGPWMALLGIVALAGVTLSRIVDRFDTAFGQQLHTYMKYGGHYGTGLTFEQDIAFIVCTGLAVLVWSWGCGFVLGSLSGRAAWLTWFLFYVVVLDSSVLGYIVAGNLTMRAPGILPILAVFVLPFSLGPLLFLLASLHGTFRGVRQRVLPARQATLLVAVTAVFLILATWIYWRREIGYQVWSSEAELRVAWPALLLPFLIVSWPAAYLLASSGRASRCPTELP